MTNATQPKPNPLPAILVYGTPSGPALTQASWFRAEDKEAVKAAAKELKFSVIELHTDADRALAAGAHEGVLKGSGRMIVGSVSAEVYRRIEEHVRKGAGAPDASKPDNAAAATTKSASEQTKNLPGPGRAIDKQTRPGQRDRRLGCASGRFVRGREILGKRWRAVRLVARHHRRHRQDRLHHSLARRPKNAAPEDRAEARRCPAPRVRRYARVGEASLKLRSSQTHRGGLRVAPLRSGRRRTRRAPPHPQPQETKAMTSTTVTTAERIRALNDAFRRTFVGGMVMITAGVEAMPVEQRRSLLAEGARLRRLHRRQRSPRRTRLRRGRRGRRPLLLEESITTTAPPSSAPPIPPTPPSPRAC